MASYTPEYSCVENGGQSSMSDIVFCSASPYFLKSVGGGVYACAGMRVCVPTCVRVCGGHMCRSEGSFGY